MSWLIEGIISDHLASARGSDQSISSHIMMPIIITGLNLLQATISISKKTYINKFTVTAMVLYAHKHAYKNTYFGFLLDI